MNGVGILWVDIDTQHAAAARRLIAARYPDWRVVNSPTPETAKAPSPARPGTPWCCASNPVTRNCQACWSCAQAARC